MPKYRLADFIVQVEGACPETEQEMSGYIYSGSEKPSIQIDVTQQMRDRERRLQGSAFSDQYLESIAVYRSFCEQALRYDVMFLHASALVRDGRAFLFSGPSGIGKSTHSRMWREAFGQSVLMVNDDKPLIRLAADGAYVYGTPWDGKYHLNTDIKMKIEGIGMIHRSPQNCVRRLPFAEAKRQIGAQVLRTENWEDTQQLTHLVNSLVNTVPVYDLNCDASTQAAIVAWEGLCTK